VNQLAGKRLIMPPAVCSFDNNFVWHSCAGDLHQFSVCRLAALLSKSLDVCYYGAGAIYGSSLGAWHGFTKTLT